MSVCLWSREQNKLFSPRGSKTSKKMAVGDQGNQTGNKVEKTKRSYRKGNHTFGDAWESYSTGGQQKPRREEAKEGNMQHGINEQGDEMRVESIRAKQTERAGKHRK